MYNQNVESIPVDYCIKVNKLKKNKETLGAQLI